ncbi:hypothetical protein WG66_016252 [Moniliophthora roreri]|nr:hypothetical protein WG66_016252 [Moniliophthora roreri]
MDSSKRSIYSFILFHFTLLYTPPDISDCRRPSVEHIAYPKRQRFQLGYNVLQYSVESFDVGGRLGDFQGRETRVWTLERQHSKDEITL